MLTVDVTDFATTGQVSLSWDDVDDPDFYAWRIYRRLTGDPVWTLAYETTDPTVHSYLDSLSAENVAQEWALVQVTVAFPGAPQVESTYDVHGGTPYSDDYWLMHPTDYAFSVRLVQIVSHSGADNYEQATIPLIDRGYRVEQGTNFGEVGSLSAHFTDRPEFTARQQRQKVELLKESDSEVWLRTPFGDMKQVALGQLSFDREAGTALAEHGTMTIPYTEVR